MTPGAEGESMDGMSLEKVHRIIDIIARSSRPRDRLPRASNSSVRGADVRRPWRVRRLSTTLKWGQSGQSFISH